MASMVSSSVMTFVTLAGSSLACSSLANRTVPVSFSISRADGADTSRAWALLPSASRAHSSTTSFFMVIPLCFDGTIYVRQGRFMREEILRLQNGKRSAIIIIGFQMRL